MKVIFPIEYFPPFASGGSEWSTYYLAKDLAAIGVDVTVVTPNYGSKNLELLDGFKIIRFPFYQKLTNKQKLPGNFALTNPLWVLWTALNLILIIAKEDPDLIHVQGKYFVPPSAIANIFFKKPLVATIRDYIAVCNYGICLMNGDKACNLRAYFLEDFKTYLSIYVTNKSILSLAANCVFAVWGRITKNYLKFFVNRVDYLISLSKKQKSILVKNGIKIPIEPMHTNYMFHKTRPGKNTKRNVLFAGRLTYGKGVKLLLEAADIVAKKAKDATFTIIGDGPLEKYVKMRANVNKAVKYVPYIDHSKLQSYFKQSMLSVVPSIWPDPLPRVAMESISNGTPVIATNSGGLPEIVKDGFYGYLCKKNSGDLAKKILLGIKNEQILRRNIVNDFDQLSADYGRNLTAKYLKVYESLL